MIFFAGIRTSKATRKLTKGFGVLQFEAFAIGLQPHINRLDPTNDNLMEKLKKRLTALKSEELFIEATTGGGKNSPGLLRERIKWVDQAVSNVQ